MSYNASSTLKSEIILLKCKGQHFIKWYNLNRYLPPYSHSIVHFYNPILKCVNSCQTNVQPFKESLFDICLPLNPVLYINYASPIHRHLTQNKKK